MISDFRPPRVTESCEAVLRRLLASCAIGGCSQSCARVARPQDASKAPCFVPLLSSSARSYLNTKKQRMLRTVSEVAFMETQLGPASRYVHPVFQHSRRHVVRFVRALVKAGSVSFAEDAVEDVGLFFLSPRRLVLRGSLLMRVQAIDTL